MRVGSCGRGRTFVDDDGPDELEGSRWDRSERRSWTGSL